MEQMVLVYLDGLVREGIRGEIMLGGKFSFSVLPRFFLDFLSFCLYWSFVAYIFFDAILYVLISVVNFYSYP